MPRTLGLPGAVQSRRAGRTLVAAVLAGQIAGLLGAGGAVAEPAPAVAPVTQLTAQPQARRIVSAWLPWWQGPAALASVRANADLYTDASPFWFQLTVTGQVIPLSASVTPVRISSTVRVLHSRGVPVFPTVVERMNAAQMAAFLGSPALRGRHVRDLVGLTVRHGVDGVDLDYESMAFGGGPATRALVRARYAGFAAELSRALRARGKKLVLTVGPRLRDTDPSWSVYDYARLGAVADRVRVMTYDYGWSRSVPRAVAPLWWVNRVVGYAVRRIPARKVWVGIPTYGYAWPARGGRGRALSYTQALGRQRTFRSVRRWQATVGAGDLRPVQAPYFFVVVQGVPYIVFYDDASSARSLAGLVGRYGLGGAAFWSLGREDMATWPVIRAYARSLATRQVLPRRSTTSIRFVPAKVRYGAGAQLLVVVRGPLGYGRPAAPVRVQLRLPSGQWATTAISRTSRAGVLVVPLRVGPSRVYRALSAPGHGLAPSASPPALLRVTA